MTREQFLQQRKKVAQVVRRKNILPCLLFCIPLFMLPFLFNKEKLPTSSQDWFLFCSLSSVLFLGTLWTFYRMYADAKLNAIHCPSCGKNNGNERASRWLIALLAQLLQHENDSRQTRGDQAARAALVASLQRRSRAAYRTAIVLLGAAMILLVTLMMGFTGESNSQGMDHPVMRIQMPLFVLAAVACGASFQKWQALEQQIHLLTIIHDLAGQVESLKKGVAA